MSNQDTDTGTGTIIDAAPEGLILVHVNGPFGPEATIVRSSRIRAGQLTARFDLHCWSCESHVRLLGVPELPALPIVAVEHAPGCNWLAEELVSQLRAAS